MKRILWLLAFAVAVVAAVHFVRRADAPPPAPSGAAVRPAGPDGVPAQATSSLPAAAKPALAPGRDAPLPPRGTPLKDAFAELQARANAGDRSAAMRLYREVNRCRQLRGSQWRNSGASDELTARKTEDMTPEQLRTYQALLDAMELRQKSVSDDQSLCDGAGDEMLGSLVANIAQAARLGDADARACYLGRGPLYDTRSLIDHPESLQAYRDDARSMIDAGLASGDWRIVDLLQQAYEPGAQGLLAGLVGADPVQHYRYLKLYRLGAEPHRIAQLDRQLASAAAALTPAQVAEADEWAQSNLRNFQGPSTAGTPQGWDPCGFGGS
jgi:hypothetical protein